MGQRTVAIKCTRHELEDIIASCMDELTHVCRRCLLEKCKGHDCLPIDRVLGNHQYELMTNVENISATIKEIESSLAVVEQMKSGERLLCALSLKYTSLKMLFYILFWIIQHRDGWHIQSIA